MRRISNWLLMLAASLAATAAYTGNWALFTALGSNHVECCKAGPEVSQESVERWQVDLLNASFRMTPPVIVCGMGAIALAVLAIRLRHIAPTPTSPSNT